MRATKSAKRQILSFVSFSPAAGGPQVLQTSDVTSPPPAADDVISPPPSSRPRMDSSPGLPLFSSPPTHVPTSEIDLSSPLNFGTPSSRIMGTPGGSRGTPIRPRGDIGHSRRVREVNLNPTDPPVSSNKRVLHLFRNCVNDLNLSYPDRGPVFSCWGNQ